MPESTPTQNAQGYIFSEAREVSSSVLRIQELMRARHTPRHRSYYFNGVIETRLSSKVPECIALLQDGSLNKSGAALIVFFFILIHLYSSKLLVKFIAGIKIKDQFLFTVSSSLYSKACSHPLPFACVPHAFTISFTRSAFCIERIS